MPTKIRKSALEHFAEAFSRTHRKGKVKEKDIDLAIALIDAKVKDPSASLHLNDLQRGILQNGAFGILLTTTIHDNLPTLADARAFLATLTDTDNSIVTATAAAAALTSSSRTLSVTAASTQSATLTYLWTRVSGPNTPTITTPTAVSTTVTGLITGTYVFKVVVTDSLSNTAEDTVEVIATVV
jgi:hypothetical protein